MLCVFPQLTISSFAKQTMNWEEPSPRPGQPNSYMESLAKEHLTLHKVLSRFLHTETVFSIMSQVFKALDEKLGEEYDRIDFKSSEAKDRVLVDVRYLQEKLGGLKGLEENGPGKVSISFSPTTSRFPANIALHFFSLLRLWSSQRASRRKRTRLRLQPLHRQQSITLFLLSNLRQLPLRLLYRRPPPSGPHYRPPPLPPPFL